MLLDAVDGVVVLQIMKQAHAGTASAFGGVSIASPPDFGNENAHALRREARTAKERSTGTNIEWIDCNIHASADREKPQVSHVRH